MEFGFQILDLHFKNGILSTSSNKSLGVQSGIGGLDPDFKNGGLISNTGSVFYKSDLKTRIKCRFPELDLDSVGEFDPDFKNWVCILRIRSSPQELDL